MTMRQVAKSTDSKFAEDFQFTDPQKRARIAILGTTGFIGSAIVKQLIELGFRNLVCLYRNDHKREELFDDVDISSVSFLQGDLRQEGSLRQVIDGADIVINAAGITRDWGIRREFWQVNVEAPQRIVRSLEAAHASTHYIHITSASIYGFSVDPAAPLKTETSPLVVSDRLYTASKVEIHQWLRERMKVSRPFPITLLAPTIVWGPGDQAYIPRFIQLLREGQLMFFEDAKPVDFIYIDDLVEAILRCLFNERAYDQEFILTGPDKFRFEPYIRKIAEFAALPLPKRRVSLRFALRMATLIEGLGRGIQIFRPQFRPPLTRLGILLLSVPIHVSGAKAERELGFRPETDFSKGIERVREYVQKLTSH